MTDIRLQNIRVEDASIPLVISKGKVRFDDTTSSVSSSESAVVVQGGVSINSVQDASSSLQGGGLTILGGLSANKQTFLGNNVHLENEFASLKVYGITKERLNVHSVANKKITMAPNGVNDAFELTDSHLILHNTTPSTGITTGSLLIHGGVSIQSTNGNSLSVAGNTVVDKSSLVRETMGVGVSQLSDYVLDVGNNSEGDSLRVSGRTRLSDTSDSTGYNSTGAISVAGGMSVSKNVFIGENIHVKETVVANDLTLNNTRDSLNSTSGGTLTVFGGASVAKSVFIGENILVDEKLGVNTHSPQAELDVVGSGIMQDLTLSSQTDATGLGTGGSLTTLGGCAVSKMLLVGDGVSVLDGNVGIGTSVTNTKLDVLVNASTSGSGLLSWNGINLTPPVPPNNSAKYYYGITGTGVDVTQGVGSERTQVGMLFNGDSDTGTNIDFLTSNNYDSGAQTRMTINKDGKVGIGTTSPQSSFHLKTVAPSIFLDGDSIGTYIDINDDSFLRFGSNNQYKSHVLVVGDSYPSDPGRINFRYTNYLAIDRVDGSTSSTKMVVNSTGNVGIGITTPSQRLHVKGDGSTSAIFTSGGVGVGTVSPHHDLQVVGSAQIGEADNVSGYKLSVLSSDDDHFNLTRTTVGSASMHVNSNSALVFSTENDGVLYNKSLVIQDGKVGVGTDSLTSTLVVNGDSEIIRGLVIRDTTPRTNSTTASFVLMGGASINKNLHIDTTEDSVSITSGGAFTVGGGASISKSLHVNNVIVHSSTPTTDDASGALIVAGGLVIQNTTDAVNINNGGSFLTQGGASIQGKTFHGKDVMLQQKLLFYQNSETDFIRFYDDKNLLTKWSIGHSSFQDGNAFFLQRHDTLTGLAKQKVLEVTTNGVTIFNNKTNSDSTSSASVLFQGGISIANSTQSTDIANGGALTVAGGVSIKKDLYLGGRLHIIDVTESSSPNTGSVIVDGGVGVKGNLNVLGNTVVTGNLTIHGTSTTVNTTNVSLKDNIFKLNAGPAGSSDAGLVIERYQPANDSGEGDVVNETATISFQLPLQSSLTSLQIKFPLSLSNIDDNYKGWWIKISSGLNAGQVRKIVSYDGTARVATIDTVWSDQNPSNGDQIDLYDKSFVGFLFDELQDTFVVGAIADYVDDRGNLQLTQDMPLRYSQGTITSNQSSNSTTAALVLSGGMTIRTTEDAADLLNGGALTIAGGASISKTLLVGSEIFVNGVQVKPSAGDIASEQSFITTTTSGTISGLSFSSSTRSFDVFCSVYVNATTKLYANFHLRGINKDTSWEVVSSYVGDETSILFSITSSGQIQYASPSYPGLTGVTFKYKAFTTSI
jgi:hypothetical protein